MGNNSLHKPGIGPGSAGTQFSYPWASPRLYAISHTLIPTSVVCINVCEIPHNTELKRNKSFKICPLEMNHAFSLNLHCYNIVWTPTYFNAGVCIITVHVWLNIGNEILEWKLGLFPSVYPVKSTISMCCLWWMTICKVRSHLVLMFLIG